MTANPWETPPKEPPIPVEFSPDEGNYEKEINEKKENIKNLADELKQMFDSIPDKSILDKYYELENGSLHNYVYGAAAKARLFNEDNKFKNESEESNKLLEDIQSIADKSIKAVEDDPYLSKKENFSYSLYSISETLDILKGKLSVILKLEGITKHSLNDVPAELKDVAYNFITNKIELKKVDKDEKNPNIISLEFADPESGPYQISFLKKKEKWEAMPVVQNIRK